MLQVEQIRRFLDSKVVAVFGVSRKKDIPANGIFEKFRKAGYEVYAINPNTEQIDGIQCYPNIDSIPDKVEAALLACHPSISEMAVEDCISQGITNIWMHKGIGNGSYSEEAEKKCQENGIEAITNGCPMMFIKPIDPFHRILKWFK